MGALLQFPDRSIQAQPQEVRVADLDDGFTRVANELLDALMRTKLSGTQSQVVMAVIRQTYGYRKGADRLHTGYLAELTGLDRTQVKRAVKALESRKILTIVRGAGIFYMASINRVISEWKEDKIAPENGGAKMPESGAELPREWSKIAPSMEQNCPTTKENNKRKQQKTVTDGASACAETPAATPLKTQVKNTPYQAILDAYHELLPEMPAIRELTDSRKTKIRNFWAKFKFNEERWRAYLGFIAKNCRWMCESRKRSDGESSWKPKNLEFLITEKCYLGVREGRFNDE
jgi:phage replication O-like protein O